MVSFAKKCNKVFFKKKKLPKIKYSKGQHPNGGYKSWNALKKKKARREKFRKRKTEIFSAEEEVKHLHP